MEVSLELKPRVSFEFEVEKIIAVSDDGNYQVQWKPAWVSKFHLVGCEHLIKEFIEQQAEREMKIENLVDTSADQCDSLDDDGGSSFTTQREESCGSNNSNSLLPSILNVEVKEESNDFEYDIPAIYDPLINSDIQGSLMDMETPIKEPSKNLVVSNSMGMASAYTLTSESNKQNNEPQHPYICHLCNKRFSQSSSLERHARIHTDEQPYACPHCSKKFSRKDHLTIHIRVHTGERPYTCQHCSYSCARKSHLTSHQRTHLVAKTFHCNGCGKSFSQKRTLKAHKCGMESVQCQGCGLVFDDVNDRNKHQCLCLGLVAEPNNVSVQPQGGGANSM